MVDPEKIAKMITEDPDVFNEGWEELGIQDPGFEEPKETMVPASWVYDDEEESEEDKKYNQAWDIADKWKETTIDQIHNKLAETYPFEYQNYRSDQIPGEQDPDTIDDLIIKIHGKVMNTMIDRLLDGELQPNKQQLQQHIEDQIDQGLREYGGKSF